MKIPKSIRVFFGLLVAVGGWCGMIWPTLKAWLATRAKDRDNFLLERIWQVPSPFTGDVPIAGILFVLIALGLLVYALWFISRILRYLEHSWVPISVLEVDITLSFTGPDLKVGKVHRVQKLHANRSDVQAYPFSVSADAANGTIEEGSLKVSSMIGQVDLHDQLLIQGSAKSLNVVEIFKRRLPTSFWASLMSNHFVLKKHNNDHWFARKVVRRETSFTFKNEYSGDEAGYSVFARRFPVSNVTLKIIFPAETAPDEKAMKGFVIRENSARSLKAIACPNGNTVSYSWKLRAFKQSELRVWWTNERLRAWEKKKTQQRQAAQRRKAAAAAAGAAPAKTGRSRPPR